jgi:hypothetical protein
VALERKAICNFHAALEQQLITTARGGLGKYMKIQSNLKEAK